MSLVIEQKLFKVFTIGTVFPSGSFPLQMSFGDFGKKFMMVINYCITLFTR